jgi:hypothetical protein
MIARGNNLEEPYHEEDNMALSVVRQVSPPSTSLEGSIVQRESSLRIQ